MTSGRQLAVILALTAAAALPGCRARTAKQTTPATTAQAARPANPAPSGGGSGGVMGAPPNAAAMDMRRKVDETVAYNQLYQIARFYILFQNDTGKPPASQQELAEYLKRDAHKEYNSLTQGLFVVVPNARLASGSVVAYEREPDRAGNVFVAMGDGSVQKMQAAQLQGLLQQR